nr:immunoglobulin heavy chain junction region [Macaca mulatta]
CARGTWSGRFDVW